MSKITSINDLVPGYAIHPGEILNDELTSRKISYSKLAKISNIALPELILLLTGKTDITPKIAKKLENSLKIDSQIWLNLQANYKMNINKINGLKKKKGKLIPQ